MKYYTIDKASLWEKAEEEVSRVADEAYAEDGTSLYDSIVLTDRDRGVVDGYVDDAVMLVVRRAYDICKLSPAAGGQGMQLQFYVPDLDETMWPAIEEELSRYLYLYACTAILQQRRPAVVPQFTERVQAAMDRAVTLLKSRKAPNERW